MDQNKNAPLKKISPYCGHRSKRTCIADTVELGDKELFGHTYPYEVNWQIGHRKWFLNTNLFIIKFDCTTE